MMKRCLRNAWVELVLWKALVRWWRHFGKMHSQRLLGLGCQKDWGEKMRLSMWVFGIMRSMLHAPALRLDPIEMRLRWINLNTKWLSKVPWGGQFFNVIAHISGWFSRSFIILLGINLFPFSFELIYDYKFKTEKYFVHKSVRVVWSREQSRLNLTLKKKLDLLALTFYIYIAVWWELAVTAGCLAESGQSWPHGLIWPHG